MPRASKKPSSTRPVKARKPGRTRLARALNYPRAGKGAVARWIPPWRLWLLFFLSFIALGSGLLVVGYFALQVPAPEQFALAQRTTVYYADGKTKLGTFAQVNREAVDIKTLPAYVPHAVVASEDRRFYINSGVDFKGIARAFVNNIQGKPRQGGSTLTQQYVENYYTGKNDTYFSKLKEAMLALKIDRQQSKEQILNNYLNTIYFGRGAYGIQMAAQRYFGVDAKDLSISQAAMLAGIIPAPSAWDPAVSLDKAEKRWNRVLNFMVEDKWITKAERDAQKFPTVIERVKNNSLSGTNGYLMQTVKKELINSGKFTADDLETGGYTIITTFNPQMQQQAEKVVADLPPRPDGTTVGLISADPFMGDVLALYGGPDYLKKPQNSVTQDRAAAGSTFKIFGLVAALDKQIPLSQRFDAPERVTFPDGHYVENFDHISYGRVNLVTATSKSINTAFINLNQEITPQATKDMAIKLGLSKKTLGLDTAMTNILGSASPTAWDMAQAFSTLDAGGVRSQLHVVNKVLQGNSVIYTADLQRQTVVSSEVAAAATYAMQSVVKPGGTGTVAGNIGAPVAGKTGTSSNEVSAWFVGYTPKIVTAVDLFRVGENGREEKLVNFGRKFYAMEGGSWPAYIWHQYMKEAVKISGDDSGKFPKPPQWAISGAYNEVQDYLNKNDDDTAAKDGGSTSGTEQKPDDKSPAPEPAAGTENSGESSVTNGGGKPQPATGTSPAAKPGTENKPGGSASNPAAPTPGHKDANNGNDKKPGPAPSKNN